MCMFGELVYVYGCLWGAYNDEENTNKNETKKEAKKEKKKMDCLDCASMSFNSIRYEGIFDK